MIYIAADHAGFELKNKIVAHLLSQNISVEDLGAKSYDKDDDFPDYAKLLIQKLHAPGAEENRLGILVCGSGQGMCIAANRFNKIRATQAWSVESAKAARRDDDANILCLAGRLKNSDSELDIVDAFLATPFAGEERFARRIKKIGAIV